MKPALSLGARSPERGREWGQRTLGPSFLPLDSAHFGRCSPRSRVWHVAPACHTCQLCETSPLRHLSRPVVVLAAFCARIVNALYSQDTQRGRSSFFLAVFSVKWALAHGERTMDPSGRASVRGGSWCPAWGSGSLRGGHTASPTSGFSELRFPQVPAGMWSSPGLPQRPWCASGT